MPKATVHKDYRFMPVQNDVRFARKSRTVQPKSEAQLVEKRAHLQLRSRVLVLYAAHVPATVLSIDPIH